ncbi:HD domain-containing protein [Alginatibacterium sediminis]|uniref:HD domain-containing protein n=1 Tax=Alginatibacterium sediminis TaxID=2164068 RepID=A0A420EFT4_9ALTE|nr:HD domain-containing phosphohydrolase [Alginatibacterium sediminis]RKF19514.1 HD domain-containing protein [Alginatibacterium sediminis]
MLINISNRESQVRTVLGSVMLALGTHTLWFVFLPMGLMLIQTGLTSKCPITHLFSKESKAALEYRYISFLPKHNPQPVFIFNANNELAFSNAAAQRVFPEINSFQALFTDDLESLIHNEGSCAKQFQTDSGKVFSLIAKGSRELDSLAVYATEITEIVALNLEIIDTQKEVVYTMGEIGESRSKETGDHVRRVAEYSELLALLSGLDAQEAELIKLASPMHDIGKVGIPDSILKKPGKLDADEFEVMKTHAQIGYDLMKHSTRPILKAAATIAGQHHEKWNGSGYPQGLSGDNIHIYGRITAVADVFDALGSSRVYKEAWPIEQVMTLFHEQQGQHFDPNLVDLLTENLSDFLAIRDKYPN